MSTHVDAFDQATAHLAGLVAVILANRGTDGATRDELVEAMRAAGYQGHVLGVDVAVRWAVEVDKTVVERAGRFVDVSVPWAQRP